MRPHTLDKKVYYKIIKRKNKSYLAILHQHRVLTERHLASFVENRYTPRGNLFDSVNFNGNALRKLTWSKGLPLFSTLLEGIFKTSTGLERITDILSLSQVAVMFNSVTFEHYHNPYLLANNTNKKITFEPKRRWHRNLSVGGRISESRKMGYPYPPLIGKFIYSRPIFLHRRLPNPKIDRSKFPRLRGPHFRKAMSDIVNFKYFVPQN